MGYEVTIVTSNDTNLNEFEKCESFKILRLPVFNFAKERYPILNLFKVKKKLKLIKPYNFDLIILQTRFYPTSIVGGKLAKKYNIPVFLIEHGTAHFSVNNKILDYLGAIYEHVITFIVKRYVSKYFGVSKAASKWLNHFNIKSSGELYNSIDTDDREKYKKDILVPNIEDKIILSYAGRIIKEKGIINLLNCFVKLNKHYDNLQLIIAGDGDLKDSLEKNSNYKENVLFTGKLDFSEVMKLYNQTDIFIHPSMFPEGLPTSILEAGLMTCSVVATARGGTIEIIPSSDYGLIVEENEAALYEMTTYLLDNKDLIIKLGKNLENRVKNEFSWENTAKKLIELIKK